MEHSYLFFDIECANCFGGVGKMCSFGYVLTDEDFNVIDSQDVAMNPEAEFDWYLFSPKNKCRLAYSKDYFARSIISTLITKESKSFWKKADGVLSVSAAQTM